MALGWPTGSNGIPHPDPGPNHLQTYTSKSGCTPEMNNMAQDIAKNRNADRKAYTRGGRALVDLKMKLFEENGKSLESLFKT